MQIQRQPGAASFTDAVPQQTAVQAASQSAQIASMANAPVEAGKLNERDFVLDGIKKDMGIPQKTQVQMEYDKDIDRLVVRYVDKAKGVVVEQIPNEKIVEFQKAYVQALSLLFDKKV